MKKSNSHTIDFLFPLSLFFVFSATALVVLILAADIYRDVVASSESSFEQTTSLAYIAEKIRENDISGSENIFIGQFDGCDALTILQNENGTSYTTYIYETDGELMELFLQTGATAGAEAGTTIMNVHDFTMEELENGLFRFTCTSADQTSDSLIIGTHSN